MKVKFLLWVSAVMVLADLYGSTVSVVAPQDGAAKSVTVGGKASITLDAGNAVALKATANSGWVFAGWYLDYDGESGKFSNEVVLANGADWRSASANVIVGDSDVTIYARFTTPAEDTLAFDLVKTFAVTTNSIDDAGRPILSLTNKLDLAVAVDSLSFPTMTLSGLPSGLSFDKSSLKIAGTPKSPGVYRVLASAKNVSGYSFSQVLYVRVENVTAEHVVGYDATDLTVGVELYYEDLDYFFYIDNTNAALKSVTISGLPSGLLLKSEKSGDDVYYRISGVPKRSGDYSVMCTAAFADGTTESASALFTVSEPDPFDYGVTVDFSVLAGYCAGDSIPAADYVVLGEYDDNLKVGVTSVSGLPTGIVARKVAEDDGMVRYVLDGMFTKAGEFTVSVRAAYEDFYSDNMATVTLSQKIIVGASPGSYLLAGVMDPDSAPGCKASGSGVYAAGATAKISASAGSDYVFAGWCNSGGFGIATEGQDYRKPSLSVPVGNDSDLEWYADFIRKTADYIDVGSIAGEELEIDPYSEDAVSLSFFVDSGSLPTLKFSNLPAGIVCEPSELFAGEYILSYDPKGSTRKPASGRYKVTVTGTNVSRLSDSAEFEVTVLNLRDDDIHVADDYGTLTPDVAMEPISLSNAVDFERGDTLTVTGLPTGLKYDDKSAPGTISGVPTKPGRYTLTFTAKVVTSVTTNSSGRVTKTTRTATATSFIAVKDYPTVSAALSNGASAAGNKVSGTGSFKAGAKTTLKAVAANGWVFAGWGAGSGVAGLAALNPSLVYVVGTNDIAEVEAKFIEIRDDELFIDDPGVLSVVKGVEFSTNLVDALVVTRSMPTMTLSGLPSGLKFDAKSFVVSGTVGSSVKTGYYYVTVAAKNAGGYSFTRVLKFVVLDSPDAAIPGEPELVNGANIDFSVLDNIYTGDFCPKSGVEALAFYVDPSEDGAEVASVSVSGLPAGIKAAAAIEDGVAEVVLYGTPSKAGRYVLKVLATYSDRSKATSEYAFIVQDGGCAWLDVDVFEEGLGVVTGSGVYASGATVKLTAKPSTGNVFAGWYEDDDMPFGILADTDDIDYRTASATFVFRKAMFENDPPVLFADFVAKEDDAIAVGGLDDVWEISPDEDSERLFEVVSASLPKLTVSGLPKGVSLNAVAGKFEYSCAAKGQITPGYYTVSIKAVNQSSASATATLSVFVANKTSDFIGGLDPSADAYPLSAGVMIDPTLIMPDVDVADGWKLTAAGLPAGLKLVQDRESGAYSVSGVPTKAGTNTVTFTATRGNEKEIATITLGIAALPVWAYGTYDGGYFEFGDGETNLVGQVTATVSESGKISGKVLKGGKTYSFSAVSYETYDADSVAFAATVTIPWSTENKEEFVFSVRAGVDGLGSVKLEPIWDGDYLAEAVQNAWLRKDMQVPVFATGVKQPSLALDNGVILKFGAKGVITLGGSIDGVVVSGKAQTLLRDICEAPVEAVAVIYVANAKFEGGAYCQTVEVDLSDEDDDGKIDTAQLIDGD